VKQNPFKKRASQIASMKQRSQRDALQCLIDASALLENKETMTLSFIRNHLHMHNYITFEDLAREMSFPVPAVSYPSRG
jgi:uncharacterized LabA/DUF88 family protein